MKLPCNRCGKLGPSWCSRNDCPLFPKTAIPLAPKQSFSGEAPNLLIGSHGYPSVRLGVLATEEYTGHDDPRGWTAAQTPIIDIVRMRGSLVNSTVQTDVKSAARGHELQGLVAQSEKPVSVDIDLAKKPSFDMTYPAMSAPHGPSVELKRAAITENVHVPTDVDKILSDELKAAEQVSLLTRKHDNYYIQKVFAAGLLGHDKKFVPTRWSITAVDDTIGKELLVRVKEYPVIGETLAFTGGHYGNWYCILVLPYRFRYEIFEILVGTRASGMEKTLWTDYEGTEGRTTYAADVAGGYYATRLSVLEELARRKRQGTVLAFRFIDDSYTHPLGVWVVREATRIAMQSKPLRFGSDELALTYLRAYAQKKHGCDAQFYLNASKLLESLKQKTIGQY